jgi:adenine-specific DNA-methyltransferase
MIMQKLELTWIGKGQEPAVEPRILIHDASKDYGDASANNMLIHGDNLIALKALEQEFAGRVKCIYIDPPFNTGQALEDYDDNLEHSTWLNLMNIRFRILYRLLDENSMFWIHLDDEEIHYAKCLLDEVFSRKSFVAHITYERSAVAGLGQGGYLVDTTEHILLYRKGSLPTEENLRYEELGLNIIKRYNRYVSNFGEKKLMREFTAKSNGLPVRVYEHSGVEIKSISLKNFEDRETAIRQIYVKNIKNIFRGNRIQKENAFQHDLIAEMDKNKFYSVEYIPSRGKYEGKQTILYYYNNELLSWLKDTTTVTNGILTKSQKMTKLWTHGEIPKADIANEGGVYFPRSKKPEQLIKRVLEMSTQPGDIVLDSFLGSGTTAAVAHKMGRRWIGIELGEHCYSLCLPRLRSVVDGEQTGISKSLNWQGGGGFKFYELAPTLIVKDNNGFEIISDKYNSTMLAAAVTKLCGYSFVTSDNNPYIHGVNNVGGFIFVTTQYVTAPFLGEIAKHFSDIQSLVICASAFQVGIKNNFPNIKLRKIPQSVLSKCEYGVTDYNLNVVELPDFEETEEDFEYAE